MKRYLLIIMMMVCAVTGAWAEDAVIEGTGGGSRVTITTNDEPDLTSLASSTALSGNWGSNTASDNAVEVIGTISQAGLDVINTMMSKNSQMHYPADKILYLNNATFSGTITSLPAGTSTSDYPTSIKFASCILPADSEIPATIPSGYNYVYSPCTSGNPIHIYVKEGTTSISQLTSEQIAAASSIIITGSGKDAFIANLSDAAKDKLPFDGSIAITTTSTDNVQAKVEAYLINKGLISNESTTEEKAAVLAQITSLTIAGPLTSTDLTYLSGLANLTALNLTGVTSFGTGVSPATIQSTIGNGVTITYPLIMYNYDNTTGVTTITVLAAGNATTENLNAAGVPGYVNSANNTSSIKICGNINGTDISNIVSRSIWCTDRIDLSEATITGSIPNISNINSAHTYYVILPSGSSAPTDEQVAYNSSSIYNQAGNLKYIIIPASEEEGHAKIFVNNPKDNGMATAIDSYDISVINANNPSVIDVYNLNGAFDAASFSTLRNAINALTAKDAAWEGKSIVYHETMKPFVVDVDECSVTIDMNEANGKSLATLISEAKKEVLDGGKTGILSLTINGPLSADDITALNTAMGTGEDLASITSLNLGGATGMAQTAVDGLTIPTSLTNLTIPSGMVVTAESTLATRAASNNDLWYIYSPTSDAGATVPDYVWVVKGGGMEKAFQTETGVRNSIYVKVASSVVLTNDDMDLSDANIGNGGIKNLQFYDLSDANLVPAVSASYKCPDINKEDGHGYRIILPNNRTGDQMAIYSANTNVGKIAAVYSYTDTKLNILEIKDDSYSQAALTDPRIMRSNTTEVDVVSGTQNGQTYSSFGVNLLAAINNMGNATTYPNSAGLNVRTVSISTGSNLPGHMTFSNPVITTLELKNVSCSWAAVNVNCSALQTLNLNYATLGNVTAQVSSLTSVDLSAATLTSVDLTGAALTTALTMDDDTNITGNLTLKSTGLTSFTPHGTIGGDIYLNASNNLESLDVRQFTQAASKKIHIDADATENESNTNVIDKLEVANAVTVPSDYVIADHFHPAIDAAFVKREAYVPQMVTKSTTTMMLHEKENTADGDNYIYWYDDQEPTHQGNNVTIGTSTESGHSLAEILTSEASIGTTTYRRAKIDGPIASTDVDDLASINCQVLDLSSATFDATAWAALKTAFAESGTGVHSNVRFVILPSNSTREEIINGTALAGLTNVLSVIALNKITGADDESDNGTNLTSWNRVSGALQAAVVAAGNHSCQSWTKTPDGKTSRNIYTSDISDFRECKISGLINSHDLSKGNQNLDANGHLSWDKKPVELSSGTDPRKLNGACTAYGPFSASFNLSVIDLKGAFFEEKGDNEGLAEKDKRYYFQDMTLSALGIISSGTYKVVVPTDPRAKEIPADFMNCSTKIRAICIPSNIVAIRTRAFYTIDYVWTTATNLADTEDPEGTNTRLDNGAKLKTADSSNFIETSALIYENGAYKENPAFTKKCYVADYSTINGGGTYTFGSNLRLIETGAFANTQPNVKDVYVLNTKAPECHVDAFNTTMYAGNNGYSPISDGQTIISRENYFNSRWITMLHYPRQTTTPNVQRYTDPTREYSIATGERDGKGAPIYFPNQSEFIRAYNQGTYGYLWNAWNPTREYGSVINPIVDANSGWDETKQADANTAFNEYKSGTDHKYTSFYKVNWAGVAQSVADDDIVPYYEVNWDETSYSTVTTGGNLYPQSEIDAKSDADNSGEMTTKDYRGWHQFVLNAYAANTILDEEPYRSYIADDEWWTICPTFDITREECAILFGQAQGIHSSSPSKYPYVSKLRYVRRFYGDGKGTITLNFTENLAEKKENRYQPTDKHGINNSSGYVTILNETPQSNDVVMSAGVPYLIKPNMGASPKRQFRIFKTQKDLDSFRSQFTDDEWNNRNFVAFAHESLYNKIKAAQAESGATQIQHIRDGMYTVPVFVSESDGSGLVKENVERVSGTPTPYHPTGETSTYYKSTDWVYTFVGTFYKSFLPHYCYYLGWDNSLGAARFFYLDGEKGKPGVFTYYDNNMNWNNETGVICPTYIENGYTTAESRVFNHSVTPAHDKTPAQWNITDLVSDSFTVSSGSQGAKTYEMVFGAPDMIADDSDVTGIENVNDDSNINNIEGNDINVYTINGQKVGTSLEDLPKGIYIVNGKKFIVK